MNKKPREEVTYIGHNEKFNGITFDKDGQINIVTVSGELVKPDAVFLNKEYVKENGQRKVVSSVVNKVATDITKHLSTFDLVLIVDTNTKKFSKQEISITSIIEWVRLFYYELILRKISYLTRIILFG